MKCFANKHMAGLAVTLSLVLAGAVWAQTLTIDPARSEVGFSVSNMGVNTVNGHFGQYTGRIEYDPQAPEKSSVHMRIQAASINTQNDKRDHHLRSKDFFEVSNFPLLSFESQSVEQSSGSFRLNGMLTIKNHTNPTSIPFTFKTTTANGKTTLQAQGQTIVNRHDFGLDYGNEFMIGKKVTILLNVLAAE